MSRIVSSLTKTQWEEETAHMILSPLPTHYLYPLMISSIVTYIFPRRLIANPIAIYYSIPQDLSLSMWFWWGAKGG